jgi:hypothetical protein
MRRYIIEERRMQRYPFSFVQHFSLKEECNRGLLRVSLERANHGRPFSICLWPENGSGIRVQSTMHDLGPRLEVGSLVFSKAECDDGTSEAISLPNCFHGELELERLLYVDETSIVESGLVMMAPTGEELIIVSGAFPYTVEISIVGSNQDFQPENPLASYKRELVES